MLSNYVIGLGCFAKVACRDAVLCSRLGSKSVLASLSRFPAALSTAQYAQAAVPKVSFKKFEPEPVEHHDIRNERLNRPLSPHLSIYQIQLTTLLSITHRTSGKLKPNECT